MAASDDLTFHPNPNLRCVVAGAGSDAVGTESISSEILQLVFKTSPNKEDDPSSVRVVYLGTPTYDDPGAREKQTAYFADLGCPITSVDVADTLDLSDAYRLAFQQCDVVIVSGGNTLYASDHWKRIGIDILLAECMNRGVVLSGGSAGAICWFDAGHSDSMDPATFKDPPENPSTDWVYIRVPTLSLLPGLVVPHHDVIQSNGVLRAYDFDEMMVRHYNERGVGLDHWSGLVMDGDSYRVISVTNEDGSMKEGSVLKLDPQDQKGDEIPVVDVNGDVIENTFFSETREGVPGAWLKDVDMSSDPPVVNWRLMEVGTTGKLSDILRYCDGDFIKDPNVIQCRLENRFESSSHL